MNILAIETSCDETAISVLWVSAKNKETRFEILSNVILSQIKIHEKYGGVFPAVAKREHQKNLVPVFKEALKEAGMFKKRKRPFDARNARMLNTIFEREPELLKQFLKVVPGIEKPDIDAIAVTHGPGLEPALWVGINFAKALSLVWNIPIIPVNHMEGHIFSALIKGGKENTKSKARSAKKSFKFQISDFRFPILALLVSGGHTELVLVKKWGRYEKIGETRDDAAGEAFDKTARMLGLPYPGGPQISKIAKTGTPKNYPLPRPMLNSKDFDFSFSGLKTAVLYTIKNIDKLNKQMKADIAREFEEAVSEVLVKKTVLAANKYGVNAVLLGGGVAANERLRGDLSANIKQNLPDVKLFLPEKEATTDNALMIAVAAYFNKNKKVPANKIKACGNLSL